MSTLRFITNLNEVQIDDDDHIIADYEYDLPHHDIICENAEKAWNDAHMEKYYDGILKDKVDSAIMKCRKTKDKYCEATILIKMKKNVRLTQNYRRAAIEQTQAQLVDGWGEGFFGMINIMSDGNTRFFVE